jgi:hypothetical protein
MVRYDTVPGVRQYKQIPLVKNYAHNQDLCVLQVGICREEGYY